MALELDRDGTQLFPSVFDASALTELQCMLPDPIKAGERIYGNPQLARWLEGGAVGEIVSQVLGRAGKPVRALLFDKTPDTNWALGWHQDRTIALRRRIEAPGFDRWTTKAGVIHVEPPLGIIERMITARIHLDPVPNSNAPLLIAPGSHRLGRIEEAVIDDVVRACGTFACLAEAGDVWVYRTAILHASQRTRNSGRRRVLQVDFACESLPDGLEWIGVG